MTRNLTHHIFKKDNQNFLTSIIVKLKIYDPIKIKENGSHT